MTPYNFAVEQLADLLKSPMPRDLAEYKRSLLAAVLIGQVMHAPNTERDPISARIDAALAELAKPEPKTPCQHKDAAWSEDTVRTTKMNLPMEIWPSRCPVCNEWHDDDAQPKILPALIKPGKWMFRGAIVGRAHFPNWKTITITFCGLEDSEGLRALEGRLCGDCGGYPMSAFKGEWRKKGGGAM